jgi:hypothetical protein
MEGNMGMTTKDDPAHDGWRKSPYSNNGGNCIEIAVLSRDQAPADCKAEADRLFVMRDSKNPAGPRLYFTPGEWDAFARGMKDGSFDDLS